MGDHRATVKIEFTYHGKTETQEWFINWMPISECLGVDQRIVDWFLEKTRAGDNRYMAAIEEYFTAQRKTVQEKAEREQLATLKAKYETAGGPCQE